MRISLIRLVLWGLFLIKVGFMWLSSHRGDRYEGGLFFFYVALCPRKRGGLLGTGTGGKGTKE